MSIKIALDKAAPASSVELMITNQLPDYDLEDIEAAIPRDVDPMLASQGFKDLLDEARAILDRELDLGGGIERRRVGPGALGDEFCRRGQAQAIKSGGHENQRVPCEHGESQAPIPEAGDEPRETGNQKGDSARGKPECQFAAPFTAGTDGIGMERGRDHGTALEEIEGEHEGTVELDKLSD